MALAPSEHPVTTVPDDVQLTVPPDLATTDLQVIITPDAPPESPAAVPVPETRAPAIVSRLVGLVLFVVGGAVLFLAIDHPSGVTDTSAANITAAALGHPAPLPATVHTLGGQRVGDVVLLRIDPVGADGVRSLVVEPGATVTLEGPVGTLVGPTVTLQDFLTASTTPAVRQALTKLRYDGAGAIRSITVVP